MMGRESARKGTRVPKEGHLEKDCLSPPSPGIKGRGVRLWQAASGLSSPCGMGPKGEASWQFCSCPERAPHVPLPSQMGATLHSPLCLEEPCPAQDWIFRKPNSCHRRVSIKDAERKPVKGKTPSTRTTNTPEQTVALSLMSCGRIGNPVS